MCKYAKMHMCVRVLRQSHCRKLKIICGSFEPADPTLRMHDVHTSYPMYEHNDDAAGKMGIIMLTLPTQGGVFGLPAGLPGFPVWRNHRHLLWHLHHRNHLRHRVAHFCYFFTAGQGNKTVEKESFMFTCKKTLDQL